MKKFTRMLTAGVVALMLLGEPALLMAQSSNATQACAQARQDVEMNINKTIWLLAGFFFQVAGIVGAYLIEPSPPASKLLGKSPEYVAAYTDCYKEAGKKIQTNAAIKGCVISVLLSIGTYGCCVLLPRIGAAGAAASTY